jgi:hypothetical protein
MPRISFEEKLKIRKVNLNQEIEKLVYIFNNKLEYDSNILFNHLDNKMGCFDSDEFMKLGFSNIDRSSLINCYLDLCDFYLLLETAHTRLQRKDKYASLNYLKADYASIYSGIVFILDKIDYQIILDENNKPFISQKDAVAEEIAGMAEYSDVKWRILEYNSYKISLDEKKYILIELYKKFEGVRKDARLSNMELETRIGELIQCVRHKKDAPKEEKFSFYYSNEEKWCDKLYDLLLEIFIHLENKKIIQEIKSSTK